MYAYACACAHARARAHPAHSLGLPQHGGHGASSSGGIGAADTGRSLRVFVCRQNGRDVVAVVRGTLTCTLGVAHTRHAGPRCALQPIFRVPQGCGAPERSYPMQSRRLHALEQAWGHACKQVSACALSCVCVDPPSLSLIHIMWHNCTAAALCMQCC